MPSVLNTYLKIHVFAIDMDGALYTWGVGAAGALGAYTYLKIHVFAIDMDGALYEAAGALGALYIYEYAYAYMKFIFIRSTWIERCTRGAWVGWGSRC